MELPQNTENPEAPSINAPAGQVLPHSLHRSIALIRTPTGKGYALILDSKNPYALPIGSRRLDATIAVSLREDGIKPTKKGIADVNAVLESLAQQHGEMCDVWLRVAPIKNGVEIDVGDAQHTRVQITPGQVAIVEGGSANMFTRTNNMSPLAMPAASGDWQRLKRYLNCHAADAVLLVAWLTFVLAHPKVPSTKYPILVLLAAEGCGKTWLCRLLISIVDPSTVGVQVFPHNARDLAIAGQHSHVLCFDNLRAFRSHMSDMLCIAATGGTITTRQLYTDAEQEAIPLHVAMVLNGIHHFIDWPDLAQRCLPIYLPPIPVAKRRSEGTLDAEFQADLPAIMRGLFDLIARILTHLPNVGITNPERMIDFVAWLAAMEKADDAPVGVYQSHYSDVLRQGQLDTLMDNPLAAAIIELVDALDGKGWSGTPSELLTELTHRADRGTQFSRDWPQNPIALSKRIGALQAGLRSQGIRIALSRGKNRVVTLEKTGELA